MKKILRAALLIALAAALAVSAALAETRETEIWREGTPETVTERLHVSGHGFSLWYAEEWLTAYDGERDFMEGVIVESKWSDDFMVLEVIPEEDAVEYVDDFDIDIVEQAAESRVVMDIYRDLIDGRYYFLTLIADSGRYMSAVGEYAEEAAEGNAVLFQKALESVAFTDGGADAPDCLIRAEWAEEDEELDGSGRAQVILTALEDVSDVTILRLDWEGVDVTWKQYAPLGSFSANQSVAVALEFIGDFPDNGIMYTDKEGVVHNFALDISGEDGQLFFWDLEEE